MIMSENHIFKERDVSIRNQGEKRKGIKIGNNCWIESNVTILDGVNIGDNVVVGAGTIITKNILSNSVVHGDISIVTKCR